MPFKIPALLLCLILSLPPCVARAEGVSQFKFTDLDKQAHMLASYGMSLTLTRFLETKKLPIWESVLIASASTIVVGASKELFVDSEFSAADMLANGIGTSVSAALVFTFEL